MSLPENIKTIVIDIQETIEKHYAPDDTFDHLVYCHCLDALFYNHLSNTIEDYTFQDENPSREKCKEQVKSLIYSMIEAYFNTCFDEAINLKNNIKNIHPQKITGVKE